MDMEWPEALELARPGSSGASIEDVAHNRGLTAGIWLVTSNGERMILKCLTPNRELPISEWDAHWRKGAKTTGDAGTIGPGKGSHTSIGSSRSMNLVELSAQNSWPPTTQTTSW
jgi:hypothetical protein